MRVLVALFVATSGCQATDHQLPSRLAATPTTSDAGAGRTSSAQTNASAPDASAEEAARAAEAQAIYDGMFKAKGGDFEDASQAVADEFSRVLNQPLSRAERRRQLRAFFKQHPKDFPSWSETKDGVTVVAGHFPLTLFDNRDVDLDAGGVLREIAPDLVK